MISSQRKYYVEATKLYTKNTLLNQQFLNFSMQRESKKTLVFNIKLGLANYLSEKKTQTELTTVWDFLL